MRVETNEANLQEWRTCLVKDCLSNVRIRRKPSIPLKDYQAIGQYPIVDQGVRYIAGWTDEFECVYSDILPLIVFGDHTRCLKLMTFPFALGADGTKLLLPNRTILDTEFLYFSFLNLSIPNKGYNRHSKYFRELPISFPQNKDEQIAIAGVLRTTAEALESRRAELGLEREHKSALQNFLFTRGTREESLKLTKIGEVPKSWTVGRLDDYLESLKYGTSKRCDASPEHAPVLRIPNVIAERIDTRDIKYAKLTIAEIERHKLEVGDILFVRTNGRREYVGRCAVYKGTPPHALFASYLIRARLRKDVLSSDYFQAYATTERGKRYLSGNASNAADGKFNINTQTIKNVVLPIPPMEEQKEIEKILLACDDKISALEREIIVFDEFFNAILSEVMSGKLSSLPLME
jgi:type I restriction enzyme, S subunit